MQPAPSGLDAVTTARGFLQPGVDVPVLPEGARHVVARHRAASALSCSVSTWRPPIDGVERLGGRRPLAGFLVAAALLADAGATSVAKPHLVRGVPSPTGAAGAVRRPDMRPNVLWTPPTTSLKHGAVLLAALRDLERWSSAVSSPVTAFSTSCASSSVEKIAWARTAESRCDDHNPGRLSPMIVALLVIRDRRASRALRQSAHARNVALMVPRPVTTPSS
jgi:hypothetical protein